MPSITIKTSLMKFRFVALLAALVCGQTPAADYIAVDAGRGLHHSMGADVVSVRYQRDYHISIFDVPGYYEFFAARWNKYDNTAIGTGIGIEPRWENFHVNAAIGVAYLENKTELSGTNGEFMVRIGAGYTLDKFDYAVFVTHLSNAKPVFQWDGVNAGYDFVTFQIRYQLD
jgi:hypothetical protein